uniref:Reverse transcriptase domain-containing protein n=1 Tax=Anguilla anguilla TaxID=7936 RepID=A0A0E9R2M8_ANGAN
MKCLLSRILPWLVEANILSTKQKTYIDRQGVNEHVFCLKTGIDDFKHESARFYAIFLDFRDAFGTLTQNVMIDSLKESICLRYTLT